MTDVVFAFLILGSLGLVFGIALGYAAKKFAVKVDPKFPLIRDALPGANCGGCGYAGCDAYAKAVAAGEADIDACPVGGSKVIEDLADILGKKVEQKEKTVAYVMCNGNCEVSKQQYKYDGIMDCREATFVPGGGPKACSYGCLGMGTCVDVCPFDAIHIVNGIAVVDEEKCTSCGKCVAACPKNIIEIVPVDKSVRIACSSLERGKDVKDACSVGCIGCRLCVRNCPSEAIEFSNNLAKIDYSKCTECGVCVEKCPTNAIQTYRQ